MISDDERYEKYQQGKIVEWESLCHRCAACCGIVEGDPCENLVKSGAGLYSCKIYENRFGEHKTVSGKPLRCVPIREILHKSWPGDSRCGYKLAKRVFG